MHECMIGSCYHSLQLVRKRCWDEAVTTKTETGCSLASLVFTEYL